jgi:glycosyltransferase involved in cell wall biosynthesis
MRVLHIARSLNVDAGGPAQSVPALCRSLVEVGAEVTLYSFRKPGDVVTVSDREPFTVRWFGYLYGIRSWPGPDFASALDKEIRRFDVVHLNGLWNPAMSMSASACRRFGVPYVITPRGMLQRIAYTHHRARKELYYRFWERRTIAGARLLHFFTAAELADSATFINGASTLVIPNGIDVKLHATAAGSFRAAHPELRDKRIMLFVGRIHWSKNLDLQLEALRLLAPEFPDLRWVVIGPDEGDQARLRSAVRRYSLVDKVVWTGALPHQRCLDALADADVFLLSSRHEAHSVAMNECLIMGVPLVMTDSVGYDEVRASGAGAVVETTPEAIAAGVGRVLSDPVTAAQMRHAARRFACENLAWPRVASRMLDAYHSVTGAAGTQPVAPSGDSVGAAE